MRKMMQRIALCLLAAVLISVGALLADRQKLKDSLIRFHVVANSDSEEDQQVKLLVRDAVLQSIQEDLASVADVEQAKAYLRQNLPKIQALANTVLEAAGFEEEAVVSLCQEAFDTRAYDTFSLPAGVYEALRIVIGEGKGHNWWCVSFPALCLPATGEAFSETAVEAGLSAKLTETLKADSDYEIRFFLLDAIGRIENSFFGR